MRKKISNVKIIILPSEQGTTMNHNVAGGVGCKNNGEYVKVAPPLNCLYIVSILKRENYEVELIDANVDKSNIRKVDFSEIECIYVLYGSLPTLKLDVQMINEIRKINTVSKIIYINAIAGYFKEKLKQENINCIISGDAELSILNAIQEEQNVQTYYNRYLDKNTIDNIPYPDWSIANIPYYNSFTIKASTGCSLGCPHCPYYKYQNNIFIPRDTANVLKEIKWLYEEYRIDYFLFRDPCFTYNMTRTKELVKGIKELNLPIEWGCETRIEFLNKSLIKQMKKAGCHNIRMGVEAVSPDILKRAGRLNILKTSEEYLRCAHNIVDICKNEKIYTIQFYMIGFPEETKESIKAIKQYVDTSDPDIALVNFIVPYPGTQYFNELDKKGLIKINDYSQYGSKDVPVSASYILSIEELLNEKRILENYFKNRNRQFYPIR